MTAIAAVTTAMASRPSSTLQRFADYAVVQDDEPVYFGKDGDVQLKYVSARDALLLNDRGSHVDARGLNLGDRICLVERFQRKPGINADIQNAAEATREIANPDFELLGVNASSDDATLDAGGGIKLETDGADGDEVIVLPHLDANQSLWTSCLWGTEDQVRFEAVIKSGSNITNAIIWAGLKLTNTEVKATDDNQAYFRYEDDVNSGKWELVTSRAGVDTVTDSGLAVAVDTTYRLVIEIDSSRVPRFYINGVEYGATLAALTNAIDLIPYVGVAADGAAAAKHIYLRHLAISKAAG